MSTTKPNLVPTGTRVRLLNAAYVEGHHIAFANDLGTIEAYTYADYYRVRLDRPLGFRYSSVLVDRGEFEAVAP